MNLVVQYTCRGVIDGCIDNNGNSNSNSSGASSALRVLLVIHPRRKTSRAPESEMAKEARVFEQSEFPRRAISDEEYRVPMHSIGERPAKTVLLPFAKTKGSRAKRESFCFRFDVAMTIQKSGVIA